MNKNENSYTNVKRAASGDNNLFIVEKQDFKGIPLKEDEAEYVCRTLALYLGLSIVDQRKNIRVLTQIANENSSKKYTLGGDDSEEHL